MMNKICKFIIFALVLFTIVFVLVISCDLSSINNQEKVQGIVDTSFGNNGFFIYNGSANGDDVAYDLHIDQNGKLVVCGETEVTTDKALCVIRVTSSGILDTGFGTNGVFRQDNLAGGLGDDGLKSFVFDSEKKIVAVGYSNNGINKDIVVMRLNSVGTLDTSFNGSGFVYTDLNNQNNIANKVIIDDSGRIIVLVDTYNGSNWDVGILRYLDNGLIDTSFNGGSVILSGSAGGNGDDRGHGVVLDSQGRIVVTGYSTDASNDKKLIVWRINPNGNLDTTFNSNGLFIADDTSLNKNTVGKTLQYISGGFISNVKVVLCGEEGTSDSSPIIMRFDYDMSKDQSFGTNGLVHIPHSISTATGKESIYDFCKDSFSRYFMCGYSTKNNKINSGIWGYDIEDMTIDKNFASNGFLGIRTGVAGDPSCDIFTTMSINSTQNLYCGGYSYNNSNYDIVICKIK